MRPSLDDRGRHLRLQGTRNLRDVGGYPVTGGRRTRWQTLYRTDQLNLFPPHVAGGAPRRGAPDRDRPPLAARARRRAVRLRDESAGPVRQPAPHRGRRRSRSRPGRLVPRGCSTNEGHARRRGPDPPGSGRAPRDHRLCRREGPDRRHDRPPPLGGGRPAGRSSLPTTRSRTVPSWTRTRTRISTTGARPRSRWNARPRTWRRSSRTSSAATAAPPRSSSATGSARRMTSPAWPTSSRSLPDESRNRRRVTRRRRRACLVAWSR